MQLTLLHRHPTLSIFFQQQNKITSFWVIYNLSLYSSRYFVNTNGVVKVCGYLNDDFFLCLYNNPTFLSSLQKICSPVTTDSALSQAAISGN